MLHGDRLRPDATTSSWDARFNPQARRRTATGWRAMIGVIVALAHGAPVR